VKKTLVVLVLLSLALPMASLARNGLGDVNTVRKNLGDINGDGKQEIAIETENSGGSTSFTTVKVKSGDKTVLALPVLNGDTADGYKVVGKQIAVWTGDWQATSSKWKPHYYDLFWFAWSPSKHRFTQVKEGFTVRLYSYSQARKVMPQLATKNGGRAIVSRGCSFKEDAIKEANRKYHQHLNRVSRNNPDKPCYGRTYMASTGTDWICVNFNRDGSVSTESLGP